MHSHMVANGCRGSPRVFHGIVNIGTSSIHNTQYLMVLIQNLILVFPLYGCTRVLQYC